MATPHIKGQVCHYVYTGAADCASIPFVGIAVLLNLYGIMQQGEIVRTVCQIASLIVLFALGSCSLQALHATLQTSESH